MYTGEGGGPLQSWLRVFIHFLLTLCLPSGSQPQPGSCLCACFSWHQAVGCHPLTPSCWSFPSSATHRAEATAREAVDTRPLDTGQQAPTSSGQHKPSQLLGPCSPGQCEPMAFLLAMAKVILQGYTSHPSAGFERNVGIGLSKDTLKITKKLSCLAAWVWEPGCQWENQTSSLTISLTSDIVLRD